MARARRLVLALAASLAAVPASAGTRANAVRSCEAAMVLALDALAATTGAASPSPAGPASCAALRTRIEAMKDAALVHHRCVPDPARAAFVDEMVDGVIALRARMEADCR